ncbi:sulfotransferase family 2 domain-containing protein [Pseudomonadota bacterium]
MKQYNPNKPLFSIHIPKCAGTSFSNILKAWFKKGYYRHSYNEKRNTPPQKHNLYKGFFTKTLRPKICIHGHFNNKRGTGVQDYYPEANQFITIFRDPFHLHVSTYFYVKQQEKTKSSGAYRFGKPHPIIANNWNLEDYLNVKPKSYICNFLPPSITLDNYRHILKEQFLFIGIAEELQRSVDALSRILQFESKLVPMVNVSNWKEQVPDGIRETFVDNNPLEMAIYAYAKETFWSRHNAV